MIDNQPCMEQELSSVMKLKIGLRSICARLIQTIRMYMWKMKGYDIHPSTTLERNLNLDRLYPQGVHIGKSCMIASGTTILSHDHCKRTGEGNLGVLLKDTYIGDRCFLAVNSLILPGVHIGDECIVGAGAVVTKDVPDHCCVAGNPAKIIRTGLRLGEKGILLNWNPQQGWIE